MLTFSAQHVHIYKFCIFIKLNFINDNLAKSETLINWAWTYYYWGFFLEHQLHSMEDYFLFVLNSLFKRLHITHHNVNPKLLNKLTYITVHPYFHFQEKNIILCWALIAIFLLNYIFTQNNLFVLLCRKSNFHKTIFEAKTS